MMPADPNANLSSGTVAGANAPASALADGRGIGANAASSSSTMPASAINANPTAYDNAVMSPQSERHAGEAKSRTTGWKIFDFVVYGLINFGGNVATSFWVANTMYDKHHTGKDYHGIQKILIPFDHMGQFLENKVFKPGFDIALKESHSKALTGLFSGVLALSWGGTLLLAPVKLIEDNKPKIVRKLDAMMDSLRGHTLTEQEKQDRNATYTLLDSHETKKTWPQAISARIYSVAVGVLGGLGLTILVDPKAKGFLRIADFWRDKVSPMIRTKAPNSKFLNSLAPIEHPEMDVINSFKTKAEYVGHLVSQGMTEAEATTHMQDVFAKNKAAWNVGNMTVELVGSGITAGMFYVKLMFEELFGKNKDKQAATAAPSADPTVDAKTAPNKRGMANGLIIANPNAKDTKEMSEASAITAPHAVTEHAAIEQASIEQATETDKQFAATLTKRDAQSTIRELAEHGSKHSAAHGGHSAQHMQHAQHAESVQHDRALADAQHGRA